MYDLLVYKQSKLEWDAHLTGLTRSQLIRKYESEGANVGAIVDADAHQQNARRWMEDALQCKSETLEEFTMLGPRGYDMVIALGGDNSFTRISQFCTNHVSILGVNSDPQRSVGHLLDFKLNTPDDAKLIAEKLMRYEFQVEDWPRIACMINGRMIRLATSELFLGERLRKNMSRHIIEDNNIKEEQKCSGLLVATGAGSSGWIQSTSGRIPHLPTIPIFVYQATEMYKRKAENPSIRFLHKETYEYQLPNPKLKVTSLNDDGIISVDSWEEWPFNRGAVAEISFGPALKVIKLAND